MAAKSAGTVRIDPVNTIKGRLLQISIEVGDFHLGIDYLRYPDGAQEGMYMSRPDHTFGAWSVNGKQIRDMNELTAIINLPLPKDGYIDVEIDHEEGQQSASAVRFTRDIPEDNAAWSDLAAKINARADALPPVPFDQQFLADGRSAILSNNPMQTTDETGTRGNPEAEKTLTQLENELRKAEK